MLARLFTRILQLLGMLLELEHFLVQFLAVLRVLFAAPPMRCRR